MIVRQAVESDKKFLSEMACLASTLAGRPVPPSGDPSVIEVLPAENDVALVAMGDDERLLGRLPRADRGR